MNVLLLTKDVCVCGCMYGLEDMLIDDVNKTQFISIDCSIGTYPLR